MNPNSPDAPRVVWQGKYQRMLVRGTWEYSERTTPGSVAAIILAVTPQDRILFVEQFRVPLQQRTIEMPAGLVGDVHAGESIEASAIRELEEETGWTAERAEVLVVGPVSAGASREQAAMVRVTGLHQIGPGGGDASEDITVHAIPRRQAPAWLLEMGRRGYALDPKLWAGLWMIEHTLDGGLR